MEGADRGCGRDEVVSGLATDCMERGAAGAVPTTQGRELGSADRGCRQDKVGEWHDVKGEWYHEREAEGVL